MTIEQYIVIRIKSVSAITDLVGDRITPVRLADETELPAITYICISNNTVKSHGGSGMRTPRYQLSIWAKSQLQCSRIRDLIIELFDCKRDGETVTFHENDNEMYNPTTKTYHIPVDIMIYI